MRTAIHGAPEPIAPCPRSQAVTRVRGRIAARGRLKYGPGRTYRVDSTMRTKRPDRARTDLVAHVVTV